MSFFNCWSSSNKRPKACSESLYCILIACADTVFAADVGKQKRERKKKKNDISMTPAEAIALQQQLFSQAKAGTAPPEVPDAAGASTSQPS